MMTIFFPGGRTRYPGINTEEKTIFTHMTSFHPRAFFLFLANPNKLSFLQCLSLDNVFFLREKNLSSFLFDVDRFSMIFLFKIIDFDSEPGEFLVFVLSTVSLYLHEKWTIL